MNGLVGFDLHGKAVGIVGTGKIGRITVAIFRGFGTQVIAHDPFPSTEWAASRGTRYVDFDALLAESDIVSLHVPLLPETRHLLNPQTLARIKPGVFIVNTSRGKLVDTGALIAALETGHVGGVALDVYEEEEGRFFEDLSGQVLQDTVRKTTLAILEAERRALMEVERA
jgi:D-lactate dehydrogenase